MARGLYVVDQLPPIDTVARAAFTTFTTFADVYGAPQKIIPKSRLEVGMSIELSAQGEFSLVTSATASVGFWFNGAASTAPTTLVAPTSILGQTQLLTPGAATETNAPWQAYWSGTLIENAAGATGGKWNGQGWAILGATATPFLSATPWFIPTTLALRTVTCDVTADRAVGVGWQWGTSSASNSVTVNRFYCKVMS